MQMKKIRVKAIGIIITFIIVLFMAATLIRKKGEISFHENRRLAELPRISLSSLADGTFFSSLGNYVSDHFAFRSKMLAANAKLYIYKGEPIINDVFITDERMLHAEIRDEKSEWKSAEAINELAEKFNDSVYVIAVPSSDGVYSDNLPEYLNSYTQKSQIDGFYNALDSSIKRIDAYSILKMLNDNYIYYRNDTRWTSYGAYCVYRTVIQKLGFMPITYDKYTIEHVTSEFRGNLYNKTLYTGTKADIIDIYYYDKGSKIVSMKAYDKNGKSTDVSMYDKSFINTNDSYKFYMGNENGLIIIKTDVSNDKKLLLIKDEYADCFIPFLAQHYSEIAVLSEDCKLSEYSGLLDINDYNQMLLLFGADNLVNEKVF